MRQINGDYYTYYESIESAHKAAVSEFYDFYGEDAKPSDVFTDSETNDYGNLYYRINFSEGGGLGERDIIIVENNEVEALEYFQNSSMFDDLDKICWYNAVDEDEEECEA